MPTIRDLTNGAAVQDGDLLVSRQAADTVDKKVTGAQLKTYMGVDVINDNLTADIEAINEKLTADGAFFITGIISGGIIKINGSDGTLFNVEDGTGIHLDQFADPLNPVRTEVSWSGITGEAILGIVTYVGIDSAGALVKSATPFSTEQYRDIIRLGFVIALDGVNISSIRTNQITALGEGYLAIDMAQALGAITEDADYSANAGANLEIDRAAGSQFQKGVNANNSIKNPNFAAIASSTSEPFIYNYRNGSGGAVTLSAQTDINPSQWDDGSGVLQNVGNSRWSNQRIFYFPQTGQTVIQFGQEEYDDETQARAAALSEVWENPSDLDTSSVRTILSVRGNATDLTDTSNAYFTPVGKFGYGSGGGGGGVSSTQDMQSTYNNSVDPEIITDSTRKGVTFRRGSLADTDCVFEVQNGAGNQVACVSGEGKIKSLTSMTNDTTTAYVVDLEDQNEYIRLDNASPIMFSVPDNGSVAFPIGTEITVRQVGAGQVTFIEAAGVTINTAETLTLSLRAKGSTATLVKVDTNEWDLMGDLKEALSLVQGNAATATLNQTLGDSWVVAQDTTPDTGEYILNPDFCSYTQEGNKRYYALRFYLDRDSEINFQVIGAQDVALVEGVGSSLGAGDASHPMCFIRRNGTNSISVNRDDDNDQDMFADITFIAIMS